MFTITIGFENCCGVEETKIIKEVYAETRSYEEVLDCFGDSCICNEGLISWAMELGLDIEPILTKLGKDAEEALVYDAPWGHRCRGTIVQEALSYINEYLGCRDEKEQI